MTLKEALVERIIILDGAMGTMIQGFDLTEKDFRGERFVGSSVDLKGNNDLLNITYPDCIRQIHQAYVDAGADIITANTFSSNRISQKEYNCEEVAAEMAREGARIARQVADSVDRQVWVAGTMGPTSKTLSLSPDMNRPDYRAVTFDEMAAAYEEQARALIEGGVDVLMLETCFDALNAKAALYAIQKINDERAEIFPVMISATINDRSGRTLTGQTLEAFYTSVSHYPMLSFGLNCSFGVKDLGGFARELASHLPVRISIHPNAGLPNEMGEYEEQPEFTAYYLKMMAVEGLLNIAGGCCGTTPDHIRAIAEAMKGVKPHVVPKETDHLVVSGLETVVVDRQLSNFVNVGERTNVAGSKKFARLIREKKYDEALSVAARQIEDGATIIDLSMDDAMLDSKVEIGTYLRHLANDPAVAKAAIMIDSSEWTTLIEGLKNAQGKCIVNSISLKNGEAEFIEHAKELHRFGAAVVVMAFDEKGQADTFERKIEVCQRAYDILVKKLHIPAHDVIFDVNVLSIGTGITEHANYGVDFIKAVAWIKEYLSGTLTSGGISNLSFSFRGNNNVREAMHSAFLYHAIAAGLDMAIVNPSMLQVYDEIPEDLLKAVEDVILNRTDDATEMLIDMAQNMLNVDKEELVTATQAEWRLASVENRLATALEKGTSDYLSIDLPEALEKFDGDAVKIIEGPLMNGMEQVGKLFGEGKMFLPQVVKSAKVMKNAVAILQPEIEKRKQTTGGLAQSKIVLATARGDVHDIGKNILSIVLNCNNFQVIDLGVMVSNETILETARKEQPLFVGISGLITPSLKEMEGLCALFEKEGMQIPIFVGGATTTLVHTSVKLAPLYTGGVVYGGDASHTSVLAKRLQKDAQSVLKQTAQEQQVMRDNYTKHLVEVSPYALANTQAPQYVFETGIPSIEEMRKRFPKEPSIEDVESLIDWRMLLFFWGFRGEALQQMTVNPEALKTLNEAKTTLLKMKENKAMELKLCFDYFNAHRDGNDIVLDNGCHLPMLRSQNARTNYLSLADYFPTTGSTPLGLFCIKAQGTVEYEDQSYEQLMQHALAARLAEATSEWFQKMIYPQENAIRPAFGYASCPDHSIKKIVIDLLDAEKKIGVHINEYFSITPSTAICGMVFAHPDARYFPVGKIDDAQLADYSNRRGLSIETLSYLQK
ncbi:MAG: methionine synthase [Prevotella sp.]